MALSNRTKTDLNSDDINNTSDDMTSLFEWEYGDTVRGTHAKSHEGMKQYRKDINKARNKSYKDVYVDTLLPYQLTIKRIRNGD
jgi:hypothetical protein